MSEKATRKDVVGVQDLECFDPQESGHSVYLGRIELAPLLDRYAPLRAVVVRPRREQHPVEEALIADGWHVTSCHGPEHPGCPLVEGAKVCAARASADVAVVVIAAATPPGRGVLPRLRCASDAASPTVVALEGRDDQAVAAEPYGIVLGIPDGAGGVVRAARRLIEPDPRRSLGAEPSGRR